MTVKIYAPFDDAENFRPPRYAPGGGLRIKVVNFNPSFFHKNPIMV